MEIFLHTANLPRWKEHGFFLRFPGHACCPSKKSSSKNIGGTDNLTLVACSYSGPDRKGKKVCLHFKGRVKLLMKKIFALRIIRKHILHKQNAKTLSVTGDGMYSYHMVLNG